MDFTSTLKGLWAGFSLFFSWWQFWAVMLAFMLITSLPGLYNRWRLSQAGMDQVDRMGGIEFEQFLETLFRRLGYRVERTRAIGDQGGDLILTGNGERIVVQAKRWSKRVGNKAIQEVAAARPHYGCTRAMVVANQEFTASARELAASNQVELWGRRKLADTILSLKAQKQTPEKPHANRPAGAPTPTPIVGQGAAGTQAETRTCLRCGRPMVRRTGKRGPFWGCSAYPGCRYTEEILPTNEGRAPFPAFNISAMIEGGR